jgi:hypothetical protein
MLVKETAVNFSRFKKLALTQSIPSDEVLSRLQKKLERDTDAIGPEKFVLNDITEQTKRIIENEQNINNAVNYLKKRQDELAEFLIKFNNVKGETEGFSDRMLSDRKHHYQLASE